MVGLFGAAVVDGGVIAAGVLLEFAAGPADVVDGVVAADDV